MTNTIADAAVRLFALDQTIALVHARANLHPSNEAYLSPGEAAARIETLRRACERQVRS